MSTPPEYVPSPCVQVCTLDPLTGLCVGCYRTVQEVADWLEMTAEEKRAVLERVAQRAGQRRRQE
jgi:hypothetical protein